MSGTLANEAPSDQETVTRSAHNLVDRMKELFRADGRMTRMLEAMDRLIDRAQKMNIDKEEDDGRGDELITELTRAILSLRQPAHPNFSNGDDSSDLKKWIAGVGIVLSAAFIVGGWSLSNQVAALTTKVDERMKAQDDRIANIERQQAAERYRSPVAP